MTTRSCRPGVTGGPRPIWSCVLAVACLGGFARAEEADYERDIKPVLQSRCYACHGALKQEGGLRLDTGRSIRQGGDGGAAVIAGKPADSLLLERVSASEPGERMPPEGEPLSAAQIERLRDWIRDGARSPESEAAEADPRAHWAFQTPRRPDVPGDPRDVTNPIDAFLDAELGRHGLTPRPSAPRHVQLRRVYLDLIGLPPTREELQAFLSDQSPDAYENVVDRLLQDGRHGERWGRHWMDVWRYSDWYGRRDVNDMRNSAGQIFRWRDWIVRSLNQGTGYDRMLQEMLAADELFPEDYEAGVATAYLIRNYYSLNPNDWMRSQVEHTGKAFLGLTFNCAHCHDHKYDPIEQDDYFRLRAFFEPAFIRQDRVPGEADPGMFPDYTYEGTRSVQRLGAVRVFDRQLDPPTWFYTGGDERNRVKERGSIPPGVPAILRPDALQVEPVTLPPLAWYPGLRPELQETLRADARNAIASAEEALRGIPAVARVATDEEREAEAAHARALERAHAAGRPAALAGEQSLLLDATQGPAIVMVSGTAGDQDLHESSEKLRLIRRKTDGPMVRRRAAEARLAAATAELASLEARIAAERAKYLESPPSEQVASLTQAASRAERQAKRAQAESDLLGYDVALLDAEAKPVDDAERAAAMEAANKGLAAARTAVESAQAALADGKLAETYAPLSALYPRQSTGRRRALALWLTSRDHPLTARVAVNHIWLRHFRSPLVASVYDFGRNGARPTHPELLDWLATEFMESGWDMKRLHRLIVTSAAYRRLSSVGEDRQAVAVDPENRLLWRMNSWRMESEVVRDSLLAVAGRLDLTRGGVELDNKDALTTRRRTLYYSSYPEAGGKSLLGELFDAPDPLDCYRRVSSIVPQQALALTNSDLVRQSSVAIVQAWQESSGAAAADGAEAADRLIDDLFAQILSRPPSPAERRVCRETLHRQHQLAADPQSSAAVVQARESLARILLNHNDFVTVR
jgi:hypothetical protein